MRIKILGVLHASYSVLANFIHAAWWAIPVPAPNKCFAIDFLLMITSEHSLQASHALPNLGFLIGLVVVFHNS